MTTSRTHRLGCVRLSARHGLDVTLEVVVDDRDPVAPRRALLVAIAAHGRQWARCAVPVEAARRLAELLARGVERVTAIPATRPS